ncbi:TonB-dependent receptor [Phenylobacterium montanum]|uniref:TonB-dependent receptor n=1 Tax=Phenylobacterium montanum TaxID=2823693 RepID=A0A975FXC9_9CAUL|nr:TonB-dependent receptor [Caulobacter sp. S6]QUD86573.1 TonB-dependent receptor [Caulobacter sp. S6]
MANSRNRFKQALSSGGFLTAALLAAGPVLAQTAAPASSGTQTVGEIVVTATRHAESLSKVSASVVALNEKALDVRGIKGIDQISQMTPGVTLNPNGFGTQSDISIRGVDSLVGAATTGIYVDDTPIMTRVVGYSSTNSYPLVFDLDRVEVLRGPQGTLFGAGSEGGTIRFITPQPSLTHYSGYARAELAGTDGGDLSYEAGGAVGGPIVDGKLGFRASLWDRHDGGYVDRKNLNPGLNGTGQVFKNANWSDTQVGRVALAWAPTEHLTITPSIFYQNRYLNDIGTFWEGYSAPGAGKFVNGQPGRQPDHDHFVLPSLNIRYELGPVELISNTSMYQRRDRLVDDYSTLNPAIFDGANWVIDPTSETGQIDTAYNSPTIMVNKQTVWTEELRAQSTDPNARLTWTVGLFISESRQKSYENIIDPKFAELFGLPAGSSIADITGVELINGTQALIATGEGVDKQFAGFGEASYHITDKLKITAGVRVADAQFTGRGYAAGPFLFGPPIAQPSTRISETPVTPKGGLSYQMDDNTLFYFTAAKGYRIGGTNAPLSLSCQTGPGSLTAQGYTQAPLTYASDNVWSYELGAKSKLFDRRLEVDASVYHIEWSNIQQLVYVSSCGQQFVDNLGQAESNGFDVQFEAHPLHGLTLDGSVGYTDATYSKTVNKNPGVAFNVVTKGDHLDTNPWSATFGVTLDHPVFGDRNGYARLDYTYHSRGLTNPVTDSNNGGYDPFALTAPATNLVNLRSGVRWSGYDVSLFVNNLTNEAPRLTRYSEVIGNPVHRDFTFRPLTVGVTAAYRY